MTRVGVISDTHVPEFVAQLPSCLTQIFAGVDVILHAGDINDQRVLSELEAMAPVIAVRGDHDRRRGWLPRSRTFEIDGVQFGLIHGEPRHWLEEPRTFLETVSLGLLRWVPGRRRLRRRFPNAQVIVFGHFHRPVSRRIDGCLQFCPGSVYRLDRLEAKRRLRTMPGWFERCFLVVASLAIRPLPPPSVGLLEIRHGEVEARIVVLSEWCRAKIQDTTFRQGLGRDQNSATGERFPGVQPADALLRRLTR